ncbi:unnamed protein product [Rotaria sp. Silwood1]|nr:unnamed protein product [Rotaria sp. Silwood1]CAF1673899.1 unnamed protein product [Rotaria sp. Silwood1]CAF3808854.1 unnamed protein product [Rotaria sp. Silwood1]CAF3820114.1 unnamed protein product [Rotaria sp. Silwood1]CAF3887639.1 unnamed protein product [Rotaria sp. Silwood1]
MSSDISNILIACLDVDSSLISSDSSYLVELFDDECVCITDLLSITDRYVYFIVSSSVGKYIVPLIYQHRCVEQIYIYCPDDNQSDPSWTTHFPKIKDCWTDYSILVSQIYKDIKSILSRSSLWSNEELIDRCYTQTLIKPSNWSSVSLDLSNVQKYSISNKQIRIIVLHCDNYALFHTDSQRFHLSEFLNVVKCVEYLETTDIRSVFLIISGEIKSIMRDLRKITVSRQIYAIYLFVPSIDQQKLDKTLCSYKEIGRLFDNLQFLLTCLTADIKFYLEKPLYIPIVSIFASQNKIEDNDELCLTGKQTKFAAFQLFVNTLHEAPASICRDQKLCDRCFTLVENESDSENALEILKVQPNKIFDWFINVPFLSVIINSFLQEQFPQNLLDIQQLLKTIDQCFAELSPTTSSAVVYRVQFLCEKDLKTITENVKELVAFHTYLLTTKDVLTARTIARQAADRGLLVIIFQIEISAQTRVLALNNNRLMFPFGSIFSIRSVDLAPDGVWYAQLKYDDSYFQSIQARLQLQMGEQLTWLTLGNYLCALNHFNEAKSYYDYLISALPKNHQALPSIYNNMGLMFAGSGDDKKAATYYEIAMNLLDKMPPNTDQNSQGVCLRTLSQAIEDITAVDYCILYDKMAEVYLRQLKVEEALKCYRKALELATNPLSRVHFEQKIKNILASI